MKNKHLQKLFGEFGQIFGSYRPTNTHQFVLSVPDADGIHFEVNVFYKVDRINCSITIDRVVSMEDCDITGCEAIHDQMDYITYKAKMHHAVESINAQQALNSAAE